VSDEKRVVLGGCARAIGLCSAPRQLAAPIITSLLLQIILFCKCLSNISSKSNALAALDFVSDVQYTRFDIAVLITNPERRGIINSG
jgi:hypothetical protein